jgi:hypothetical protein
VCAPIVIPDSDSCLSSGRLKGQRRRRCYALARYLHVPEPSNRHASLRRVAKLASPGSTIDSEKFRRAADRSLVRAEVETLIR